MSLGFGQAGPLLPDDVHLLVEVDEGILGHASVSLHAELPSIDDLVHGVQRLELHLDERLAEGHSALLVLDLLVDPVPQLDAVGALLRLSSVHEHLPELVLDLLGGLHDRRGEML